MCNLKEVGELPFFVSLLSFEILYEQKLMFDYFRLEVSDHFE